MTQKIGGLCDLQLSWIRWDWTPKIINLSKLKFVLEVAELIIDLDSEVLHSEFEILIAKSMIFWTRFGLYTVHKKHGE